MPISIGKIFKHRRRTSTQPELSPNLDSPPASSATAESNDTSSGRNSHVSLGGPGVPQRKPLTRVPESAADYRIPAELETTGNMFSGTGPLSPQQPYFFQPREPQQQPQPLVMQYHHQHQQPQPQPMLQPQQQHHQHQHQQQQQQQHQHQHQHQHQQQRIMSAYEETTLRGQQANGSTTQQNDDARILQLELNASADNVRRLRELIRKRYELDLFIWEKRNVAKASRTWVEPKCKRADAILKEIMLIVDEWDETLFEKDEWPIVKRIKARLSTKESGDGELDGPANWGKLPPWDRRDRADEIARPRVSRYVVEE